MNPVIRLLEEHWNELQDLRTEYWGYALSTARADRDRLEHSIARIYQLHDMEAPQVVWLSSLVDAKLCKALCTFIDDPNVRFSLRGPFGLNDGKDGFVTMSNPDIERRHKERLQREFPTLYTESVAPETVSNRILNTFVQPNVNGGRLYRTLHAGVGVVSKNPLKIVLREDMGRLPEGAQAVSLLDGDSWREPLPAILDLLDSAFNEEFGEKIAEYDDTQWLDLWHRYEFKHEKSISLRSKFQDLSAEGRAEVCLYLRRITGLEAFGCYSPIGSALSCARVAALKLLGREHNTAFEPFIDAIKAGGWWWPFEGVCLAFDNPAEIHLDAQMRLHNENGKCMSFRDGWGFSAVHGVRVPEIVTTNQFTTDDIDNEPNAEVRRVMLNRFGVSRYVLESGAQEVQADEFGRLYRKNLANGESMCIVEVINKTAERDGNRKKYHLCVPPEVTSAKQAVAWTFGMSADEYNPVEES